MQISCSKCDACFTIQSGSTPKFCSECGAPLGSDELQEPDQTVAHATTEAEALTLTHRPTSNLQGPAANVTSDLGQEEIGPYRLVRQLGQGGMGSVFEAVHQETGQPVALKLLIPSLQGTDESIQRFRRESQIAASLNHPRSTFVYGAGKHEDQFYITMELMDGGTLKDIVTAQGPVETGRAVDYILDIIDGLQVAHAAGIVHRDLKPSNCFLDREGRVKVGDYGLAKSFLGSSELTQTGAFMGTPQYAAPEQLRSGDIDERVDIYALGATLFYLLAGQPCFRGNPAQVIASIASEKAPKVSEVVSGVPRPLVRLIAQTMEKDPARRPQNLEMLRDMLLPYSTRGASLADVGRRLAAFFVDMAMVIIINMMVFMALALLSAILGLPQLIPGPSNPIPLLIVLAFGAAYFVLCEHYFGRGVGKWLMGMRVIGGDSESPSLTAATLRVLILPGLSWLVSILITSQPTPASGTGIPLSMDFVEIVWRTSSNQLLSWSVILVCMVTVRRSNGYRGIHELLSGTRVVRLAADLEFRRIDTLPITAPVQLETEKAFGSYRAIGRFGDNLKPVPYLGIDPELGRDVWIYDELPPPQENEAHRYTGRVRRLRMIHDGRQTGLNWYVTEAVKGAPLAEVLHHTDCSWQAVRPVLLELVIELQDSGAQGILPIDLGVDHVWLDESGRIKLLDFPVVTTQVPPENGDDASQLPPSLPPENRLLLQLLARFVAQHDVPLHVRQLLSELRERVDQTTMLALAEARLSEAADRPANWNWDDRLGVLAVTAGIEMSAIMLLINLVGLSCFMISSHWLIPSVVSMLAGVLATYVFGYCFDGGIALRLSEVAVLRQKTMRSASKWRCAARNTIACLPIVVLGASSLFMTSFANFSSEPNLERGLVQGVMLLWMLVAGLASSLMGLNVIISLLHPARNITDCLTGTRLSRQ
ncbi:MAG: protein kinase [Mariniblastus sp.]|nr:protein kinase [Mariniblastus sp.]